MLAGMFFGSVYGAFFLEGINETRAERVEAAVTSAAQGNVHDV